MALLEYVRGESKAMRGDRRTSGCVVGIVVGGGIAGRVVTEGVVCGVGNGIGVLYVAAGDVSWGQFWQLLARWDWLKFHPLL